MSFRSVSPGGFRWREGLVDLTGCGRRRTFLSIRADREHAIHDGAFGSLGVAPRKIAATVIDQS
jgi:hypothetical protein